MRKIEQKFDCRLAGAVDIEPSILILSENAPLTKVTRAVSLEVDPTLFESLAELISGDTVGQEIPISKVGRNWRVVIIEAGISDNNNWYRPSVLQESIPHFEGAPIRIYEFDGRLNPVSGQVQTHNDHMASWVAARDAGSVTGNTVGALKDVKLESVWSIRQNRMVPALTAKLDMFDPKTRTKLVEARNCGLMDPSKRAVFELSIEASGPHVQVYAESGQQIKRVESISSVKEVTIVSRGAAGGRFLEMIESFNGMDDNKKKAARKQIRNGADQSLDTGLPGGNTASEQDQDHDPNDPMATDQDDEDAADDMDEEDEIQDQMMTQTGQQPQGQQGKDQEKQGADFNNAAQQNPQPAVPAKNNSSKDSSGNEIEIKPDEDLTNQDVSQGQKAIRLLRAGNLDLGIEILEDVFTKASDSASSDQTSANNGSGSSFSNTSFSNTSSISANKNNDSNKKPLENSTSSDEPGDGNDNDDDSNDDDGQDSSAETPAKDKSNPSIDQDSSAKLQKSPKNQPQAPTESIKSKKLKRESAPIISSVAMYELFGSYGAPRMTESSLVTNKEMEPTKMPIKKQQELQHGGSEEQLEESAELQESGDETRDELYRFAAHMAEVDRKRESEIQSLKESYETEINAIKKNDQKRRYKEALRESQQLLGTTLKNSQLPIVHQSLIAKAFADRVFESSELYEAMEDHRKLAMQYSESMSRNVAPAAQVNGYSPSISFGRNGVDWFQAEMDRAFGFNWKHDKDLSESQKDTYRQLPEKASILRPLQVWHDDPNFNCMNSFQNSGPNALFREATSGSAGLSVALQNSMTKALLQAFKMQPALWREIADTEPVANYLTNQRIVLGGLGVLPQVVENDTGTTYLRLGIPNSDQMTFNIANYGGLICVTRQAILNDNLQVIQAYPQQAAEAAVMTLNLLIFGMLTGAYGNTNTPGTVNTALSYDNVAIYSANHNNYTNSPLGYDSMVGALNRLSEQRKFGNVGYLGANITSGASTFTASTAEFAQALATASGAQVGTNMIKVDAEIVSVASVSGTTVTINGTFANNHSSGARVEQLSTPLAFSRALLVVATQQRQNAYGLLATALEPGTSNNTVNFLAPFYANKELLPLSVHSMYLNGFQNDWYIAADKPIRVGFLGGREDPQLMLQDNPLVNNVFSGDLLSWKCFHEYGATQKGHLQVQGGIVGS